jgi:hypothetical protein
MFFSVFFAPQKPGSVGYQVESVPGPKLNLIPIQQLVPEHS